MDRQEGKTAETGTTRDQLAEVDHSCLRNAITARICASLKLAPIAGMRLVSPGGAVACPPSRMVLRSQSSERCRAGLVAFKGEAACAPPPRAPSRLAP